MPSGAGIRSNLTDDDASAVLARSILVQLGATTTVSDGPPRSGRREPPTHAVAPGRAWPWLPTADHGHLAPHPFCEGCGGVKYVGSSKALKMGTLVNMATRIADRLEADGTHVTEAQLRLIMKRLEAEDVDDAFVMSREMQERALLAAFARYTGHHDVTLRSYMRAL